MRAACVAAVCLAGCAALDAETLRAAIVDGAPAADEAVVALAPRRARCEEASTAICSGTLVAPRIVLTAAHCLEAARGRGELEVVFGDAVGADAVHVVVLEAETDPEWDDVTNEHDAAILLLAEDAPAEPVLARGSIEDVMPDAVLRAVGFGVTTGRGDDTGVRREGTMTLGEIRATSFDAMPGPSMTCHGDSGGPVFAPIDGTQTLVGVTSRGDPACESYAFNVRVDALGPFLDPAIAAAATRPLGWPADAPAIDALADYACAVDEDCPALMRCGESADGERRCELPRLGPGAFGAACATDAECGADATCARLWPTGADACRCLVPSVGPPPPPPPDDGGGCRVGRAPGRDGPIAWMFAAGLALARRRGARRSAR